MDIIEPHDAREGDGWVSVSTTPSENTVRFYIGRGYRLMGQPLPHASGRQHGDDLVGEVAQRVELGVVEEARSVVGDAQRPHAAAVVEGERRRPRRTEREGGRESLGCRQSVDR